MKTFTFNPKPISKPIDWVWIVKGYGYDRLFRSENESQSFLLELTLMGVKAEIVKDIY